MMFCSRDLDFDLESLTRMTVTYYLYLVGIVKVYLRTIMKAR